MTRRLLCALLLAALVSACAPPSALPAATPMPITPLPAETATASRPATALLAETPTPQSLLTPGRNALAVGTQGMVSGTIAEPAVRAGLEVLQQGGSAVDAALATALGQIALVPGGWITLAGILTMMYYDASTGQVHSLNAAWDVPAAETDPLSIPAGGSGMPSGRGTLVPGFMAGVQAAHERFGKLPWEVLFEPSIQFAEQGFYIDALHAQLIQDFQAVLSRRPGTRQIFIKGDGQFYAEGDLFRQPELAQTLRAVAAQGAAYMYTGAWAERFVQAVQSEGGELTLQDMAAYEVMWPEAVHTTYREYEVYGPGLPGLGGVNTVEALNLLEAADWKQYGHYASSPQGLFWLMQILRTWRLSYLSPADLATLFPGRDLSLLSRQSKETAQWIWEQMERGEWLLAAKPTAKAGEHSAAVVAVDPSGNVAAIVHTSNALFWGETGIFVDGVHVPDAGTYQRSMMAQAGAGNRLPEPTNPVIILRDGQPVLASSCIGQVHGETMQRLVSVLDFGMGPRQALEAPWLMSPGGSFTQPVERVAEGQFDALLLEQVREMGQPVEELALTTDSLLMEVGYWIGVVIDPQAGTLQGAAPMILGGTALGY